MSHHVTTNEVCVMTVSGKVLYNTAPGVVSDRRSGSVDTHGYVLVADLRNNRIVVLTPTSSDTCPLKLPFFAPGQTRYPMGLWLDETRGRLYVGEFYSPYRLVLCNTTSSTSSLSSPRDVTLCCHSYHWMLRWQNV
jgi:hypothetical protein